MADKSGLVWSEGENQFLSNKWNKVTYFGRNKNFKTDNETFTYPPALFSIFSIRIGLHDHKTATTFKRGGYPFQSKRTDSSRTNEKINRSQKCKTVCTGAAEKTQKEIRRKVRSNLLRTFLILFVALNRFTGTNQISIAKGIVNACYRWPVFVYFLPGFG